MTTPNNSDQAALLPCPWCGEPLSEPVTVSEGSTFRWRKVDGCCTDGPEIRHNTMADDQAAAEVESHAEAVAAWNRRAGAQAALRDELRARLLELIQRVSGACTNEDAARWCLGFIVQYGESISAALSLPASEAVNDVLWRIDNEAEQFIDEKGMIYLRYLRDLLTTPQPAPSAHAGGEAVPVDALREYVVGLKNVVDTADMMGGARTVLRWKIADELTALLSGGAARDEK